MKELSIKEKAEENCVKYGSLGDIAYSEFVAGANYVLEQIEKELTRRMLEDYNQDAEEDEVAQGCMASMIMFVRQLKSNQ